MFLAYKIWVILCVGPCGCIRIKTWILNEKNYEYLTHIRRKFLRNWKNYRASNNFTKVYPLATIAFQKIIPSSKSLYFVKSN